MDRIFKRALIIICWSTLLFALSFLVIAFSEGVAAILNLEKNEILLALIACIIGGVLMDLLCHLSGR